MTRGLVLILGCGDVGSAVAHRLFSQGYRVMLHDAPRPSWPRRGMALVDAAYKGEATLAGVTAKRWTEAPLDGKLERLADHIPLLSSSLAEVLQRSCPGIIVDARMRKHETTDVLVDLAALTIGLGPGFVAGVHADVVIETAWGHLGRVIREGCALPVSGGPRRIQGYGRKRIIYSSVAGTWHSTRCIGERVEAGDFLGMVDDVAAHAPLDGILRGLSADGADIRINAKVAEVDTRGDPSLAFGIGERPTRIADGVYRAVAAWDGNGVSRPTQEMGAMRDAASSARSAN